MSTHTFQSHGNAGVWYLAMTTISRDLIVQCNVINTRVIIATTLIVHLVVVVSIQANPMGSPIP